jgi:hypothetical protein
MGKRTDTILLYQGIVFVLEFKVGADTFDRASTEQVIDYALDLKNFHNESHARCIVPILIATPTGTFGYSPTVSAQLPIDESQESGYSASLVWPKAAKSWHALTMWSIRSHRKYAPELPAAAISRSVDAL